MTLAGEGTTLTAKTNGFGDFEFEGLPANTALHGQDRSGRLQGGELRSQDLQGHLSRRDRAEQVREIDMAGIASYGAYIPYYRLSRAEIAKAWGNAAGPGERAVASYDEDSLTMAVAAARDCLTGIDRASIGGLYFASTTAPYKRSRARLSSPPSWAWRRKRSPWTSPAPCRSGTNALRAALDAVVSGSAQNILVCAADTRLGYPAGPAEMNFGDGAAALLVSAGRDHRRGQAVRDQVLRDPGHLALGQGHVRSFGRRPLRHGRGLRSRDEGERVGRAEEARSGTGRHRAGGAQFAQRPPAACPGPEAGL